MGFVFEVDVVGGFGDVLGYRDGVVFCVFFCFFRSAFERDFFRFFGFLFVFFVISFFFWFFFGVFGFFSFFGIFGFFCFFDDFFVFFFFSSSFFFFRSFLFDFFCVDAAGELGQDIFHFSCEADDGFQSFVFSGAGVGIWIEHVCLQESFCFRKFTAEVLYVLQHGFFINFFCHFLSAPSRKEFLPLPIPYPLCGCRSP